MTVFRSAMMATAGPFAAFCLLLLPLGACMKPSGDRSIPKVMPAYEPRDCAQIEQAAAAQVARFDLLVQAKICQSVAEIDVQRLAEELEKAEPPRLMQLTATQATQLQAMPPRLGTQVDLYVIAPEAVARARAVVKQYGYSASGLAIVIGPYRLGAIGHSDITYDALRWLKSEQQPGFADFSEDAILVLRDAVQDPDLYEWLNPSAHAQAGNDNRGRALVGPWQAKWQEWMRRRLGQSLAAAKAGRVAESLYFLGYALHGVEDLASHFGRTNGEHAYMAYLAGRDPDADQAGIERARQFAYKTLRAVRQQFAEHWGTLAKYQGPSKLSSSEKERLLGHGRDFNPVTWMQYRLLAEPFSDVAGDVYQYVRWCHPDKHRDSLPRCDELLEPLWKDLLPAQ